MSFAYLYPSTNSIMLHADRYHYSPRPCEIGTHDEIADANECVKIVEYATAQADDEPLLSSNDDNVLPPPPPPYSARSPSEQTSSRCLRSTRSMNSLGRANKHRGAEPHTMADCPTKSRPPSYNDESFAVGATTTTKGKQGPPSLTLEVLVGHKLATKWTKKRNDRHQERLEQAHKAWKALGLDTRELMAKGKKLPPNFWDPPRYDAREMNRRLAELCL